MPFSLVAISCVAARNFALIPSMEPVVYCHWPAK
jgi:hypothetical protein